MSETKGIGHFKIPVLIFVIITAGILLAQQPLQKADVDYRVLLGGNLILFLVSVATGAMARKALGNTNPHAFTRAVYAGFVLRLFVCAIAAGVYIIASGDRLNKYGLFGSLLFYFVYTFIEITSLQRLLKQKKNA